MSHFPAEWEYEFLPMPLTTICDHCGRVHIAEASIMQVVHFGRSTVQYHYCSQACREEHYLARLREGL